MQGSRSAALDDFLRRCSSTSMSADQAGCLPAVHHAPGYQDYSGADGLHKAHEAGFDAYMTGAVLRSRHLFGVTHSELWVEWQLGRLLWVGVSAISPAFGTLVKTKRCNV